MSTHSAGSTGKCVHNGSIVSSIDSTVSKTEHPFFSKTSVSTGSTVKSIYEHSLSLLLCQVFCTQLPELRQVSLTILEFLTFVNANRLSVVCR